MPQSVPDEWREDRMYGVKRADGRRGREIPPDQAPADVLAAWMLEMLRKTGGLTQRQAIWGIREIFGPEYLGQSAYGRPVIPRPVLDRFRKLDPEGIVWSQQQRGWRPRRPEDPPDRRNVP